MKNFSGAALLLDRVDINTGEIEKTIKFSLPDFDRALAEAGGWVEYADSNY